MTQPSHGELRAHRRVPTKILVDYHYGDVRARCAAENVSKGGVFLVSGEPAPEGTRIYMRLYLPRAEPCARDSLEVIGVVVRSISATEGRIGGMGVHFEVAFGPSREALAAFIERLLRSPESVREVERTANGEYSMALSGPEADAVLANAALGVQDISGFFEFDRGDINRPSRSRLLLLLVMIAAVLAVTAAYFGLRS
ncbi:MAG: PilZ domain-containing protein [Polyangiaceae bacterium]